MKILKNNWMLGRTAELVAPNVSMFTVEVLARKDQTNSL